MPYVPVFSFHHQHLVWFVFSQKQRGCRDATEAPEGPPVAPCWDSLGLGQRLWSCFQMFLLMGKKHVGRCSRKRILPNAAGAKTQCGLESRWAVWVLLAAERLVLWKWFGRGSMSMNYWRIRDDDDDDDGQAAVDRHNTCFHPVHGCCAVMIIKQWHHLYSWTDWYWSLLFHIFRF